jgi:hypothetical protein
VGPTLAVDLPAARDHWVVEDTDPSALSRDVIDIYISFYRSSMQEGQVDTRWKKHRSVSRRLGCFLILKPSSSATSAQFLIEYLQRVLPVHALADSVGTFLFSYD